MKYFDEDIFFQDIVSKIISFRIAYVSEGIPVYFYVRLENVILNEKILVHYCSEKNKNQFLDIKVPFNTHLSAICLTSEGVFGFHCVAQPSGAELSLEHFYILYPRHIWRIERRKNERIVCHEGLTLCSLDRSFFEKVMVVDVCDKGIKLEALSLLEGDLYFLQKDNQDICLIRPVWSFQDVGSSKYLYGFFIKEKLDLFGNFFETTLDS